MKSFEHDNRIIVAKDLDALCALKNVFRRAHGVLCPYAPLAADQKDTIIAYARSRITQARPWFLTFDDPAVESDTLRLDGVRLLAGAMCAAFAAVVKRKPIQLGFSVNQEDPKEFHRHRETLTYTLAGPGTVGQDSGGAPYMVSAEHLFLMGEELMHKSPAFTPDVSNPRILLSVL